MTPATPMRVLVQALAGLTLGFLVLPDAFAVDARLGEPALAPPDPAAGRIDALVP